MPCFSTGRQVRFEDQQRPGRGGDNSRPQNPRSKKAQVAVTMWKWTKIILKKGFVPGA
ncbi:Protein of unknown function [Pyronema omphalodes CBS 100304]|nr:Protein of unknown function [Pyronema omphalodes CBS 100304]